MRPIPPKGFSIAIPMAPKKGWADWGTSTPIVSVDLRLRPRAIIALG
jgi:hypothetical protein